MNRKRVIAETILGYNGFFTFDRVKKDTKIEASYCTNTLFKFCKEGMVKKVTKKRKEYGPGDRRRFLIVYLVTNRNRLAATLDPKTRKGPVLDRAWFVMRSKFRTSGSFNLRDIVVLGGVKKATAKCYLKILRRAGIVDRAHQTSWGFEWRLTGKYIEPARPCLSWEKLKKSTGKKDAPRWPLKIEKKLLR